MVSHYQPSETAPLLQCKTARSETSTLAARIACWCLLTLTLSLMVYQTSMHRLYCPPDPATRDATRRDWEQEARQHNVVQREWELKSLEQAEKEGDWRRAAERHAQEVERREREERERHEELRQEWDRETQHHVREFEEMLARERELRELERERWQREVEGRDQREEEERLKRHMFWGGVTAHACTTYATRAYSAQLMNLPRNWKHRLGACNATPLEIHGVSYLPTSCEDKGPGVVIGRWEVNQQEPDCTTFWDKYHDNGCTSPGSGKKYITHKLINLPKKGVWEEFCATTPASFNHMHFPGAQECFTTVWGVYGRWEIDDKNC